MSKARRLFKQKFDRKVTQPVTFPGVLGNPGGIVAVPGRPNYVYVRALGDQVLEVYNTRVTPKYGLPVVIGTDPSDPGRQQVLSVRSGSGTAVEVLTSGYAPADRYRWMAPGGGQDPLFVEMRQFLPLRVAPVGGLSVAVYPGIIYVAGAWYLILRQTIGLAEHVPETEGMARFVLIAIDEEGELTTLVGDEVAIADLAITDIPEMAPVYRPLAAVRLYYGQPAIYEGRSNTDMVDLRWSQGIEALSTVSWDSILGKPAFGALALKDLVAMTDISATGTRSVHTVLRGDGVWALNNDHSHKTWVETSDTETLYDSALLTTNGTGNYANAFNKNLTDQWLSNGASHWVTIAFSRPRVVKYIKITANAGDWMWADFPDDIYIYGSNIGTFTGEEVELDHYVPSNVGIYTRNLPTPRKSYRYFKMTFGRPSHGMRVNEIQLYTLPDQLVWDGQTLAQAGISEIGHTHVETDITDLDHDAQKIKGIPLNLSGLADGDGIIYDQGADEWIPGASSGGGGGGTSGDWLEFIDGVLVVETDVGGTYIVPRNSTIEAVMIHCKDQGSASSTIVDVNLNGTTIFTTQANRPELTYDDADGIASGTPDVVDLVAGDMLTIDIDQVATDAESLSFIVAMTVNPTSIGSLDDVDLTGIVDGNVLIWDDGDGKFIAGEGGGGTGGADILEVQVFM